MSSSTITLILSLVTAFVFLRWFLTPSDGDLVDGQRIPSSRARRPKVIVTPEMIETVQQAACHNVTAEQIRYDLEKTGSVDETVMNIVENNGNLPFPRGSSGTTASARIRKSSSGDAGTGKKSGSLNLQSEHEEGPFNGLTFEDKKREMIMNSRKRLLEKEGIKL